MLHRQRFEDALAEKAAQFQAYRSQEKSRLEAIQALLVRWASSSFDEVCASLSSVEMCGALPSREVAERQAWVVPFEHSFANHQEARQWALFTLKDVPVLAVDGSHLLPDKELSFPVAAVQAGWFLNPHDPMRPFQKDVQMEILGPLELLASGSETKGIHEQWISLQRYRREVEALLSFLSPPSASAQGSRSLGLAFFDGSLLVSFAEVMMELYREAYIGLAASLLSASEEAHVPLIGYVDSSQARDLCRMLELSFAEPLLREVEILDAHLLSSWLPSWGDRSAAFVLRRPGILKHYHDVGGGIGFVYLRASSQRPPVRIEFPLWLIEAGLLDVTLDRVRAELIVGNGSPYALEAADQLAWFSPTDRRLFQRWLDVALKQQGLSFQRSAKSDSKARYR